MTPNMTQVKTHSRLMFYIGDPFRTALFKLMPLLNDALRDGYTVIETQGFWRDPDTKQMLSENAIKIESLIPIQDAIITGRAVAARIAEVLNENAVLFSARTEDYTEFVGPSGRAMHGTESADELLRETDGVYA